MALPRSLGHPQRVNIPSCSKSFACHLGVLLAALAAATTLAADPFTGTWQIRDAKTLTGQIYGGTVRIASIGAVYEVRWNTSAGNYSGLGLADGDKLCTGWGGKVFGVVLYKINADGTLTGRWTIPGANEAEGAETAAGGTPGKLEGEYEIKGTNPGGKGGYTGKLRIRQTGETYQLRWTIPGQRDYYGVGLKVGDSLHAGWSVGSATYAVISYDFKDPNAPTGLWTVGDSRKTAKEDLKK